MNGADTHITAAPETLREKSDGQFSETPLPPERNGEAHEAHAEGRTVEPRGEAQAPADQPRSLWLYQLPPEARRTLHNALAILYKLAGVDIVREQIETCFPGTTPRFTATALVLMRDNAPPVLYRLRSPEDTITPEIEDTAVKDPAFAGGEWRPLPASNLLFCRVPVSWRELSYCWFPHSSQGLLAASVPLIPTGPPTAPLGAPLDAPPSQKDTSLSDKVRPNDEA
jgi:hypothetical protein